MNVSTNETYFSCFYGWADEYGFGQRMFLVMNVWTNKFFQIGFFSDSTNEYGFGQRVFLLVNVLTNDIFLAAFMAGIMNTDSAKECFC